MDAVQKELASRKNEIKKELRLLFNANNHITEWDVPETDEKEAAELLLKVMQEAMDELKEEIRAQYQ
jgi:hypothetical protein